VLPLHHWSFFWGGENIFFFDSS